MVTWNGRPRMEEFVMNKGHWQDWVNYLVGLCVLGSPWLLEHTMVTAVPGGGLFGMWNLWIVGRAVVVIAGKAPVVCHWRGRNDGSRLRPEARRTRATAERSLRADGTREGMVSPGRDRAMRHERGAHWHEPRLNRLGAYHSNEEFAIALCAANATD